MTQLFCKSTHSYNHSAFEISEWVKTAKALNVSVLTFAEMNTMGSTVKAYRVCKDAGIKFAPSVEMTYQNVFDKGIRSVRNTIIFTADTFDSYRSLVSIFNDVQENYFYYVPRVTFEHVKLAIRNGLHVIIPHTNSVISNAVDLLAYEDTEQNGFDVVGLLNEFLQLDEVYLSVPTTNSLKLKGYLLLGKYLPSNVKLIFGSEAIFPSKDHIELGLLKNAISMMPSVPTEYNVMDSHEEVYRSLIGIGDEYVDTIDSLYKNTVSFTDRFDFDIIGYQYELPDVSVPRGYTVHSYYEKCIVDGWNQRVDMVLSGKYPDVWGDGNAVRVSSIGDIFVLGTERSNRVKHEYDVIEELGFVPYFMLAKYMVDAVDDQKLSRNHYGRGSGAGSLIVYLLNITGIDPLTYNLLFERFLNRERVIENHSLPDLDLDFSDEARVYLYNLLKKRYGNDKVINIGTNGALGVSSVIRDLHKYYDDYLPLNSAENQIVFDKKDAEYIPMFGSGSLDRILMDKEFKKLKATLTPEETIEQAIEVSTVFKEFYEKHSRWIHEVVLPLCGMFKTQGVHASGVIILPDTKADMVPYRIDSVRKYSIANYDMEDCEFLGLVKMDMLGLKASSMIGKTRNIIESYFHEKPLGSEYINRNIPEVFKTIENKPHGLFQLKSDISRPYLKELHPDKFEDIAASIALLRSGPMSAGTHMDYLKARRGETINYGHPIIERVLSKHGGVLFLQEQIMQLAVQLSGFTPSRADDLRKAAAKKKKELMASLGQEFIEGAIMCSGVSRSVAEEWWQKIEYMAEYLFNYSHAVSYAAIGYEMAYLKTYWPSAFWVGVLSYASDDIKMSGNIYENKIAIESEGLTIDTPKMSGFYYKYWPNGTNGIYWPISGIKGVTESWGKKFYDRSNKGSYDSIQHISESLGDLKTNFPLGQFKALLFGGFFEEYGNERALKEYYQLSNRTTKKNELTKSDKIEYENILAVLRSAERYFLNNSYVWKSITKPIRMFFPNHISNNVILATKYVSLLDGDWVAGAGIVNSVTVKNDKNGNRMAMLSILDYNISYRVVLFSSWYTEIEKHYGRFLNVGDVVEFYAMKQISEYGESIIFNDKSQLVIKLSIPEWDGL